MTSATLQQPQISPATVKNTNLRTKLSITQSLYTVLLALLVGIIFTIIQTVWDIEQYNNDMSQQVDHIYQLVDKSVKKALLDEDSDLALYIAEGIKVYPNIYRVDILDQDELLVARFINHPLNGSLRDVATFLLGENKIYKRPLISEASDQFGSEQLGEIRLYIDTEVSTQTLLQRLLWLFTVGLLRNTLLAFLLSLTLYYKITAPLIQLTRNIAQIDHQAPNPDIIEVPHSHRQNELGLLITHVKTLLEQLGISLNYYREAQDKLTELANTDGMTGLLNRRAFQEIYDDLFARQKDTLCMILLDIDHFKQINDRFGHDVGDHVIIGIANILQSELQEGEYLARIGGEEFVILIADCPLSHALARAENYRALVHETDFNLPGNELYHVTISLGVSHQYLKDSKSGDLFKRSDQALYQAKQQGRNRVKSCRDRLSQPQSPVRLDIKEADLKKAFSHQQFKLVYQPILRQVGDGTECRAIECLVRWQHPEAGNIMPDRFLPLIKKHNLMTNLFFHVATLACEDLTHHALYHETTWSISLNLSALDLQNPVLADKFAEILATYNITPKRIVLEITETEQLENTQNLQKNMQALSAMGCRLALDDFGTGYASLHHLQMMDVGCLKIDKSLIHQLPSDSKSAIIVESLIKLARNLNQKIIAEGVETLDQYQWLIQNGCTHLQGYFFAREMSAPDLKAFHAHPPLYPEPA